MKQFIVFVRKEFRHIFRDKRTMLILLVMPIIMIILFGFAITTEVKDSRVVILDHSKDEVTTRIQEHIRNNRYFTIVADVHNEKEIQQMFLENNADLAVIFSHNFSDEMRHSGKASIQLLADGSEPNQAAVRTGYMQQILAGYLQDYIQQERSHAQMAQASMSSFTPSYQIIQVTKMLYNPQSRSEYNFVPGVIGLILLLICAMMTSIAIVKEKEMGTMEILLASPLPPIVIVGGKVGALLRHLLHEPRHHPLALGLLAQYPDSRQRDGLHRHLLIIHIGVAALRIVYLQLCEQSVGSHVAVLVAHRTNGLSLRPCLSYREHAKLCNTPQPSSLPDGTWKWRES